MDCVTRCVIAAAHASPNVFWAMGLLHDPKERLTLAPETVFDSKEP